MIEVEVKLPAADLKPVREGLAAMGFVRKGLLREEDHYYDRASGEIRKNGEALRIRKTVDLVTGKEEVLTTFKGKKTDQVSMTRQELETYVGDGEVFGKLLNALGYEEVPPAVIKVREELSMESVNACLDEVEGLGSFLELEIVIDESEDQGEALGRIEKILQKLGYTLKQSIRTSYLTLLQRRQSCRITVGREKGADFPSISEALSFIEERYRKDKENWQGASVFIRKGTYEERVEVKIPKVALIGEECEETVITGSLYAYMYSEDIGKLGTFRTYTMLVDADDVQVKNLTIANTAGYGDEIGQAIALYSEGDRLVYENCRFLGYQDTLYTGPLPPKEYEKNGFIGPKQYAPRINGRQYYRDCYIEGTVDFIFGSATAYFENCTIFQKDIHLPVNGYATAASTAEGEAYGYVFEGCRFLSDAKAGTCYLGRPWRHYAQTVILHSYLGEQLSAQGWHDWGKTDARSTVYYAEYENYGPGNCPQQRPDWIHYLTEEEAGSYTREKVLQGKDGWNTGK